jgi:transcriptional regulator with XRE-family HTH domain
MAQTDEELRDARLAAGLSQERLGRSARMSKSTVGRLERGEAPEAPLSSFVVLFALLGQRLGVRPYPEGPPLRDVAHARLLSRLRETLPVALTMRTEVPIVGHGDLRAWDATVSDMLTSCAVEAETALRDLQALDRRIGLKLQDSAMDNVILLVASTRRNRRILGEFRALIAARHPLESRAILATLRAGHCPHQRGVLLL